MRDLPVPARLYVAAVIAAGFAAAGVGALALVRQSLSHWDHSEAQWANVFALIALVNLANITTSRLGRETAITINVIAPVALGSVLLLGPTGAPLVLLSAVISGGRRGPAIQRLFNGAMGAVQAWLAGVVYVAAGGAILGSGSTDISGQVVLASLLAALVYEFSNALLLVTVITLTERISPLRVWYGTLAQSALPLFIYSIFGLMLAVVWSYVGAISAVLVLAPLLVARWVFASYALRQEAYEATMRSLIKSVETKDLYTRGHSERVSRASVLIGRHSGMREDRVASLRYAGMLHDVGKLGVPTSVLQKSGRLTDAEYEAIQQHTVRGREIVKDLEFLGEAIEGILLHHERIDGRGYPLGKSGSDIPEFARIIAVADAFDSMTTTRSYRGARPLVDAFEELRRCKGSQFDPVMVEALIAAIEAQGWDASDTVPSDLPSDVPSMGELRVPSFASDDDDPTVARQLGLPMAAPDDASELDALARPVAEELP